MKVCCLKYSALKYPVVIFLLAWPSLVKGDVGDPTLKTDHPHYPGEGAFQTVEDCVRFAIGPKTEPQEKAIALYLWLLKHQWHLLSPQECSIPGLKPDIRRDNAQELIVADANRARFSYGYGLCGTVHAWNEPYWKVLGMNSRRRAFPGHTNSEIEYGGSWHTFDTDMAGLIFRKDGIVAGYEDVIKDPGCAKRFRPPLPHYPFDWPNDAKAMEQGWAEVAKGGNWFKMYNGGYAAHPGIVHIRSGESFTRYWDRDQFGGPGKRRFWHIAQGGPSRNWAFFGPDFPQHDGPKSNSQGSPSYSNGVFDYQPPFERPNWKEGLVAPPINVDTPPGSRILKAKEGNKASITFGHFSPYVICGDPLDNINPMTGPATDGFVVQGMIHGEAEISVSNDQGQTWSSPQKIQGTFKRDFTDLVKGHYGWQAKLVWSGDSAIESLRFLTTTQVCQAIYPKLQQNGSTVLYRATSQSVLPILPNLGGPETDFASMEVRSMRSANVTYQARNGDQPGAFQTKNNKPGTIVFRLDSTEPIIEISAAGKFRVRVPPPEPCDFHWDYSLDGGKAWILFGKAEVPADNEHSSGWMSGKKEISGSTAKSVLIRATIYAGGYLTSLTQVQIYGVKKAGSPSALKITYSWKENSKIRSHSETIPAGRESHSFRVPTGSRIEDHSVKMEVP